MIGDGVGRQVCGIRIGRRVNGGLLLLRPNASRFEELLPMMWDEIGCYAFLGRHGHAHNDDLMIARHGHSHH